ncbi:nuclease-related domain-containing protein [Sphingomonas sp. NFX23]|uniref:nuclease-related domain-containing protein n=1 Tax=Sphingomonas sp. NFX23 TaxID=2819532 RepID=UPI003CE81E32
MIVKPSTKADECAAIAAFMANPDFDRLPERARKQTINRQRGLNGERSTAHILDRHFQYALNHALLHDLRLPDGIGGFAQFDHVILSRQSRSAAVVEVKNYRGRISKNEHNEWHVWYEGRRRPIDIPNPLEQARRQREVLRAWLKARRHDVAFETIGAFVIIPPDCSIDRSKVGADVPIYKADNFIAAWTEFGGITPIGRLFSTGVSAKTLLAISGQLAGEHQPDFRSLDDMIGSRSSKAKPAVDVDEAEDAAGDKPEPAVAFPAASEAMASATEASPVVASTEHEATAVTNDTAPITMVPGGKASDKIEIVPGIYERVLPDGRVAFLSGKDEAEGVRLKLACEGLARWNPRYRNWLSDAAQAPFIREAVLSTFQEQTGDAPREPLTAPNHARQSA